MVCSPGRETDDKRKLTMKARLRLIAMLVGVGLALGASADELKTGDAVPVFSAKDQFGKDFKFEPGLHFLLLGFDMTTSKVANHKLADLGAGWLEKQGAAYVLDIHTMPGIARVFALPKMRKYPERIILGEEEKMLEPFPRQAERITVLVLTDDGKIKDVKYWNPESEALDSILK